MPIRNLHIVNGPNLNLLGRREPKVYGSQSFEAFYQELTEALPDPEWHYFQSNHEGELLDYLHRHGFEDDTGIILNAGAYTHTSIALADAIAAIEVPVMEVHISNVYAREAYRHHSTLSAHCAGVIVGCGLEGYRLAATYLLWLR